MEKPTIYHLSSTAKDKLLNIIHNIPKYAVQERSEDVIAKVRAQRAARENIQDPCISLVIRNNAPILESTTSSTNTGTEGIRYGKIHH